MIQKITWEDACDIDGWTYPDVRESDYSFDVETVGFVLKEDDEYIWIARDKDPGGKFDKVLRLPKKLVKKRETLYPEPLFGGIDGTWTVPEWVEGTRWDVSRWPDGSYTISSANRDQDPTLPEPSCT